MTTVEFLGACCMCDKIRISENPIRWIGREPYNKLYDLFIQEFELSHGYCPEHYEEAKRDVQEYKRKHPKN